MSEPDDKSTHMWNNEIFLDVHEVIDADSSKLRELLPAFLEECADAVAFLTL